MHEMTTRGTDDARLAVTSALAPRLVELAAVAREQHVTRAAAQLGVPQPTLSRRIARLEQELGVELLARSGRQVRLTPAGRRVADAVTRALDELDSGLAQVVGDANPDRGRVTLGFLHTLGPVVVPRLLRHFRAEHPGIRFDIVQESHESMLARLRDGSIDLCLTSPLPEDPTLGRHALLEQQLVAVLPAGHALAGRRRLALDSLSDQAFVGLRDGYGLRRITDEWCAQAGFVPQLAFAGEDTDTVRGLVAAGLGIALLPHDADRVTPGTVEIAVRPSRTRSIGLLWVTGRAETAPVKRFRDFLLARGRDLSHDDPEPVPAS